MAAEHTWGPDVGCLQGKTVRRPGLAIKPRTLGVPMHILENHMEVTVIADILTVNGASIESVKRAYMQRGFMVRHMIMDNRFECLREQLTMKQVNLIMCSEDEHVGDIECLNRTIQERVRSVYMTLPYKRMPRRIVVELVHFAIF
eukprot:3119383-Ditylum_brightwellii.AAC.1